MVKKAETDFDKNMRLIKNVISKSHAMSVTPPVDDDFPQVKHEFDAAVKDYAAYLGAK